MFFSSIKFIELLEQLDNSPINLFNILSFLEKKTKVPLNADWTIFKENDDTVLFEQIIKEYGADATLQKVFDYLLELETIYSNLLSDYLVQYREQNRNTSLFDKYGYNLKNLKQDDCFHREQELELIKICLKRNYKNNIMLIGEPGVGKTFLVASIAYILNIDVYYIDISSILSGSKYRGDFEKKFHDILNEALKHKKILFFDEAHTILNTGNSDGGISAADILKPYLMCSDFQIIGATTRDEAALFTRDKAFERRFNFIQLDELTLESTKDIIKNRHQEIMSWDQQLLDKIFLYLDNTFMSRSYPDKALDFFDFYFSGEKLSSFKVNDMEKVFSLFNRMNNILA
ncbi:MAG: ATP-dependent Clp protease ATP-binding subunit [Legionella sp.]|nr:ATP-dependent Clp protease ATP-binding subunit [Legionella sp.]